jgi:hypothetical protein
MAMAADITDAVVGVDTHRDTHSLQISTSGGVPIAQCTVGNDDAGFAAAERVKGLRPTGVRRPVERVSVADRAC